MGHHRLKTGTNHFEHPKCSRNNFGILGTLDHFFGPQVNPANRTIACAQCSPWCQSGIEECWWCGISVQVFPFIGHPRQYVAIKHKEERSHLHK